MTYQRNIGRLEVEEDVFDKAGEGEIGDPEIGADHGDGDDDDDRRREELAPAGPFDLLELADGLGREAANAPAALAARPGLALRLADRLDLAPALTGALGGRLKILALAAGALRASHYLVSRWRVCEPHQRQYFFVSNRSGVFRFDLFV
jgi:hypothetical protein